MKLLASWRPFQWLQLVFYQRALPNTLLITPKIARSFQSSTLQVEFTVNLEYSTKNQEVDIKSSGVIRTARLISKGEVYISI
jgi:2-methylaconitate cis-trans-isomerase PrpF